MKIPIDSHKNELAKFLSLLDRLNSPSTKQEEDAYRESIFIDIQKKIAAEKKEVKRKKLYRITQVAAIVLCIISIGLSGYYIGQKQQDSEVLTTVELLCPAGITQKVTLSDGSIVTLNHKSRLIYPLHFGKQNRIIELDGEGYFDIAKDKDRPFIIKTKHNTVKVLGTKFNLKAYEDERLASISLDEGQVEFKFNEEQNPTSVYIKKGEQIVYNYHDNKFIKTHVVGDNHKSWIKGELSFKDASLSEICVRLEKRFNNRILIMNEDLLDRRYTAKFKQGDSLDKILGLLSYKRGWVYQTKNDTTQISIEK